MLAAGDDELQLRLLGLVTEGMPSAMHLVMALQATRRNIRKLFLFFFLLPRFLFCEGWGSVGRIFLEELEESKSVTVK